MNTRVYRLGKRAEQQEETRRRILEAAVDLHCTFGPAHTTIAQIAERAGVQRNTYYAHFPDERSLLLACSGLTLGRDPLPDVDAMRTVRAGPDRVREGVEQFYAWYNRNAQLAACVLRDAEHHPLTREIVELRMAPTFRNAVEVLGERLGQRSRALLRVALDFACWRNLSQSYTPRKAAKLMADAILSL